MRDSTNALAALRRSALVRDDTGPSRVYRDPEGRLYHSVTSILSATADKSGLEGWAKRQEYLYGPGAAIQDRATAATRGNEAHSNAEYLLKTTNRVARATANKRGCHSLDPHGLPHIPSSIFRWALERTLPNLPKVSFSAAGYARGLCQWIATNVVQCHACEFSVSYPTGTLTPEGYAPFMGPPPCRPPLDTVGFAGTADSLISLSGAFLSEHGADPSLTGSPFIADWKTSANRRSEAMLHDYRLQCGAYSLGLERLTGVRPAGAVIVVARRAGPPDITLLDRAQLDAASTGYLERCAQFFAATSAASR